MRTRVRPQLIRSFDAASPLFDATTDGVVRTHPRSVLLEECQAISPGVSRFLVPNPMSANKKLVEKYLTTADKSSLGALLADDVEWVEWADGVPASGAITRGREAHIKNYGDDDLRGEIHRLTEEGNVVVVEGTAHVTKRDGARLSVRYVNIFEVEDGKIKRKSSFGALIQGPA